MNDGIEGSAEISVDGAHRYRLTRRWRQGTIITFIMLNPSLADGTTDDRTISKLIKLAAHWGYGGLDVLNLYAYRTPYPRELWQVNDPVGPLNDEYLRAAGAVGGMMVAAWGNHARADRIADVLAMPGFQQLHCLTENRGGQPKHPLYHARSEAPRPWSGARIAGAPSSR